MPRCYPLSSSMNWSANGDPLGDGHLGHATHAGIVHLMRACGEGGSAADRLGEEDQRRGRGRILTGEGDDKAFGHFGEQQGRNRSGRRPGRVVVVFRTGIRRPGGSRIGRSLLHRHIAAGPGGIHDIARGLGLRRATTHAGHFARHAAGKGNRTGSPAVGRQGNNQSDVYNLLHDAIVAEGWAGRNGDCLLIQISVSIRVILGKRGFDHGFHG